MLDTSYEVHDPDGAPGTAAVAAARFVFYRPIGMAIANTDVMSADTIGYCNQHERVHAEALGILRSDLSRILDNHEGDRRITTDSRRPPKRRSAFIRTACVNYCPACRVIL